MAIKTAEFEHPEIDKYRIIVPEHLEQDVIRRFHKSPQEGHFATQVTANKVLNHFWITTPIASVTRYITQCLECQLKKKASFIKSNHKDRLCSQIKLIIQWLYCT